MNLNINPDDEYTKCSSAILYLFLVKKKNNCTQTYYCLAKYKNKLNSCCKNKTKQDKTKQIKKEARNKDEYIVIMLLLYYHCTLKNQFEK